MTQVTVVHKVTNESNNNKDAIKVLNFCVNKFLNPSFNLCLNGTLLTVLLLESLTVISLTYC